MAFFSDVKFANNSIVCSEQIDFFTNWMCVCRITIMRRDKNRICSKQSNLSLYTCRQFFNPKTFFWHAISSQTTGHFPITPFVAEQTFSSAKFLSQYNLLLPTQFACYLFSTEQGVGVKITPFDVCHSVEERFFSYLHSLFSCSESLCSLGSLVESMKISSKMKRFSLDYVFHEALGLSNYFKSYLFINLCPKPNQ